MSTVNVMIVGVGGQGSLLASRLLGAVCAKHGYDVKVSEVHGMSQRGGSVVTYVRFGEKVYSPLVTEGEADYIISLEALEGARYLPFLKKGGRLIANCGTIPPMAVLTGKAEYPKAILESLEEQGVSVSRLDALQLAVSAHLPKAVNTVIMGYFAYLLRSFSLEAWLDALKAVVKEKYTEANIHAFMLGYSTAEAHEKEV